MHSNKRTPSTSRSRSLSFSPFEFALRLHRHLLRTSAFGVVFPLAGPSSSSSTHAVAAREGESRNADRAAVCLFGDVRTVGSTWPNGMQVGLDERNVDRWMQSHPEDHFDAEGPALRRDDHGQSPSTQGGRGTNAGSVQTFLYNALEPGGFDVFAVTLPRRPVWKYELFAPPPQGNEKQQSDENQLFLSHEQDHRVLFLDEDGAARADEGAAAQHLRTVPLVPHAVDADESNRRVCRFATPGTRPSSCFVAARVPRAAESIGIVEDETPEDPKWATFMWTRASATWRSSVGMNKDIKICHNMLLAREAQTAFRYKYILRLRPDMVFLSQFPKLEALFSPRTSSTVSTEDAPDVASASPASSRNTIYVNSVTTYCCGNPDLFAVGLRETMQSCYTNMDEHWWRKNPWFDESDPLSWLYNRPGETAVKWSREDKKVVTLRWTPEDWKFALCEHFGVTMEPLDAINMTLLRPNVTGRAAKYIEVNSEKNGVLSRFRKAGEHAGREL